MWRDFFGSKARIIGIDLNPDAKRWEEHGFEIYIGDQSKSDFWQEFKKSVANFDILLDDGGHTNLQQLVTLFETAKIVNPQGLIVIEDTHTSYQKEFGNPSRLSFINVSKRLIDNLNIRFENTSTKKVYLEGLHSIEYFESMVAFKFNKTASDVNSIVNNDGIHLNNLDFRYENHNVMIKGLQLVEKTLSLKYEEVGSKRRYLSFLNIFLGNVILKKIMYVLMSPSHKFIQFILRALLRYETFTFLRKLKF